MKQRVTRDWPALIVQCILGAVLLYVAFGIMSAAIAHPAALRGNGTATMLGGLGVFFIYRGITHSVTDRRDESSNACLYGKYCLSDFVGDEDDL